jgi:flagellar hook protein FlgE
LSGLNASSKNLDVIGNNVANASTVGFKGSQAQFADVYAASLAGAAGTQIGLGTQVATVAQQFTQGNISTSSNPLDVAINGKGFFRMSDNGAITYTRNGQFQLDKSGFIVDSAGRHLTGYGVVATPDPNDPTQFLYSADTGTPIDLQIAPNAQSNPKATSTAIESLNLNANDTTPTLRFDPTLATPDPLSYNSATSMQVFDSLGNSHNMTMYFVKITSATPPPPPSITGATSEWAVFTGVDGVAPGTSSTIGGGQPLIMGFDDSGKLVGYNTNPAWSATTNTYSGGTATNTLSPPPSVSVDLAAIAAAKGTSNGAATPLSYTLDFKNTTQFGAEFAVSVSQQNGYTSGQLSGYSIGKDGAVLARYTNGQAATLGFIRMTNFPNPQGLTPIGGNQWVETADSGQPIDGTPGTGSFGVTQSGATEDSNVDLTAELVNMITAQRVYQANAQTIKTQDQILNTLVNLR